MPYVYALLRLLGRWATRILVRLVLNRLRSGTPQTHRRVYRREVGRWLRHVDINLILKSLGEGAEDRRRAVRILRLIHHQAMVVALPEHFDETDVARPFPSGFTPNHQREELKRWLEPLGVTVEEVGPVLPG